MVVILGLVVLIASAVVVAIGVLSNSGSNHALGNFGILGLHINNGSTGTLFLYGTLVGIVGTLGLALLWGALARRLSSGGMRRELKNTKRETEKLRYDRDRLNQELEIERNNQFKANSTNPNDNNPVAE